MRDFNVTGMTSRAMPTNARAGHGGKTAGCAEDVTNKWCSLRATTSHNDDDWYQQGVSHPNEGNT